MSTRFPPRDDHSEPIGSRKAAHLEICTDDGYEVEPDRARFDELRFLHNSLPEVGLQEIDLSVDFLGQRVALPLFISSMTGGSDRGYELNEQLAQVAQEVGIPIGTGSIRILLRHPEYTDHFALKQIAVGVPVFANIGAVQLPHTEHDAIFALLDTLRVDAVAVHLNPGQELAQPEGDSDFRGIIDAFGRFCKRSPVPVIAKETGFGIRPSEARALRDAGAALVDVAGSGGTNWSVVEGYRTDGALRAAADELALWGAPTAILLAAAEAAQLTDCILASGGIRTGLDVAKSLALGAISVGMALPFARAVAGGGVAAGVELVDAIERVVTNVMVLTSSRSIDALRRTSLWSSAGFSADLEAFVDADAGTPVGSRR